jgi:hypothetical protein
MAVKFQLLFAFPSLKLFLHWHNILFNFSTNVEKALIIGRQKADEIFYGQFLLLIHFNIIIM